MKSITIVQIASREREDLLPRVNVSIFNFASMFMLMLIKEDDDEQNEYLIRSIYALIVGSDHTEEAV